MRVVDKAEENRMPSLIKTCTNCALPAHLFFSLPPAPFFVVVVVVLSAGTVVVHLPPT